MKVLLSIVAAVAVSGCAAVSYGSLDEAYDALKDPELTVEEKTATDKWIERFTKDAKNADLFFLTREVCQKESGYAWVCRAPERYDSRKPPETLEEKVKVYRSDRAVCGCVKDALQWLSR